MNVLNATINHIESKGNLSHVNCTIGKQYLKAVVIGNSSTMRYLYKDNAIDLIINESEIAIAKNNSGLFSISNQVLCKIVSIKKGEIFSRIELNIEGQKLHSLLTTESCLNMDLNIGESVTAFIKSNEIFLKQQ